MTMPELTGPFETGKLPKIAHGAVTVAIARTINEDKREQFEAWANEMIETAYRAPGSLGGTVLSPAEPGDPYHMVFRFVDVLHLREWERSPEREKLRERGDEFILEEKVTVTAGGEEFFDALTHAAAPQSRFRRFVNDLFWVYPVALTFTLVVAPYFARLDVLPRVLVSTAFIGATSKIATEPIRRRLRRRRSLPHGEITR